MLAVGVEEAAAAVAAGSAEVRSADVFESSEAPAACVEAIAAVAIAGDGEPVAPNAGAGEAAGTFAKVREFEMAAPLSLEGMVGRLVVYEPDRGIEGDAATGLVDDRMGLAEMLASLSRAGELVLRAILKESRSRSRVGGR